MPNETRYLGWRHTTGDASRVPWVGAILVPTDARDLHFASAADEGTDWNVANPTHPTLYIHSETTPATDYISLSHDGTTATIAVVGGTTASLTGADLLIANGQGLVVGHSAQITFNALVPEAQVLGTTVGVDGALAVALYSATASEGPQIILGRSKSATLGTNTIVASGDVLGSIIAMGADGGTGFDPGGSIRWEVDGTPGAATDMPTRMLVLTSPDGSQTQTESFRVASDQNVYIVDNNGLVVGHTAQVTVGGQVPEMQMIGTGIVDNILAIEHFGADADRPAAIWGALSRGAVGAQTVVQSGDQLFELRAIGSNGTNFNDTYAVIRAEVDGTPGATDAPGRWIFQTSPDGSATPATRVTIASTGLTTFAAGSTPASVGTTPGTAHAGSITATGGLGGDTTIGTTGVGGIGGGFSFTGGAGGTANSATTAATGGAGGAYTVTTGAGAATAVAGVTSTGGASGVITLLTGDGGAVSLAVSGTATGGAAGLLTIRGGVGGAVTATTGTNVGGAGGGVSVIAGAGGAASGATDTGGGGGTITITAGAGGNGDTSGAAGNVNITAGAAGTGGNVAGGSIKLTSGVGVGSGAVGTMIISGTVLMDDRSITTISTDSDVIYTVAQIRTGVIIRDSITANRNDSMPTAANLVAGIPNAEVGTSFFFVLNNNDDASTLTMTTAANGITYDGNVGALAAAASRLYLVVITNVTGAAEAATVFGL